MDSAAEAVTTEGGSIPAATVPTALLQVKDLINSGLCLLEGQGSSHLVQCACEKHPQGTRAEWVKGGHGKRSVG